MTAVATVRYDKQNLDYYKGYCVLGITAKTKNRVIAELRLTERTGKMVTPDFDVIDRCVSAHVGLVVGSWNNGDWLHLDTYDKDHAEHYGKIVASTHPCCVPENIRAEVTALAKLWNGKDSMSGSRRQQEALTDFVFDRVRDSLPYGDPAKASYYEQQCQHLNRKGLLLDPCPEGMFGVRGSYKKDDLFYDQITWAYKYGSAWLKDPMPLSVEQRFKELFAIQSPPLVG